MVTFGYYVPRHQRRSDGSFPVKIRVTLNRKSRFLPTTMTAYPSDLTKGGNIRNGVLIDKCNDLIRELRTAVASIDPFVLEGMDVDTVIERIREFRRGGDFRLDFFQFADGFIAKKSASTQRPYRFTLATLERFLGRRSLDVNEITRGMLLSFVDYCEKTPKLQYSPTRKAWEPSSRGTKKRAGSSSLHIAKLSHIFNAAKARYNDEDNGTIVIPKSPFSNIPVQHPAPQGQKNLGVDVMQKIILSDTFDPAIRTALDVFVVSFGLMGANLADLYEAKPPRDGVWVYNRKKTSTRRADRAEMRVRVPDELAPFIARLQDAPNPDGLWLPAIRAFSVDSGRVSQKINRELARWAKVRNLDVFTMYAGRKTWASAARRAGVEKATIDECLAHVGDYRIADIYIDKDWDLLDAANRKVIDLFEWPSYDSGSQGSTPK